MRDIKPTAKQQKVFDFIKEKVDESEESAVPSYKEISEHFGFSDKAAREHVNSLVHKGLLARIKFKRNTLHIPKPGPVIETSIHIERVLHLPEIGDSRRDVYEIPVYRRISAAHPFCLEKDIVKVLPLSLVDIEYYRDQCFAFPVISETMTGIGILPDDLVIARRIEEGRCGSIVLVSIGRSTILRRMFFNGEDKVILIAENPVMSPQTFGLEDVNFIGEYIGLYRM